MKDLRSEIRAAFEREQEMNPPTPGLRQTIVRAVSTRPQRQRNLQWVAVAAAVLFTALVVSGLMSTRLLRSSVPTHPAPTPSAHASPVSDYGPPPAGVALIYVQDPSHPGWYTGFDWTGKPRGTIKLASPDPNGRLTQSSDGSGFAFDPAGKGGYAQFLDRLGQSIGTDPTHYQSELWADDSRHLCVLSGDVQSGYRIGLRTPGAPAASMHAVAVNPSLFDPQVPALAIVGCSVANDQAILSYNVFGSEANVWVARLSDGTILLHRRYPANAVSDVVASSDSTWIAENSSKSVGYLGGNTAPQTVIRLVSNSAVVINLDPSYGVIAFSRDNSQALVYTSPLASGVATHLAVVNLRSGAVVWRSDGTQELSAWLVQPDGGGFALLLKAPSSSSVHPAVSLVIVESNGTEIDVPGGYLRP